LASPRRSGPFIIINCPSIPEELFESELFGYEPGAFTGANKEGKMGKFEMANGGTIFLDEISSLTFNLQAKLLRILQDQKVEKLGSKRYLDLNFRVISASNQDPKELVNKGLFREDLYYRLGVLTLHVPPLREKVEDIPLLVDFFLRSFREEDGLAVKGIRDTALNILGRWSWPGNIRELKNILKKAATTSDTGFIAVKDLADYLITSSHLETNGNISSGANLLKRSKRELEHGLVKTTLLENNWNKSKSAKILGISRPLLYSLIKKYQLSPP
jgi:transcriptional regulator with PAS, ATPase and Fis domain